MGSEDLQADELIRHDAAGLVGRAGIDATDALIAAGAGDEERSGKVDAMEAEEIQIAAVHDVVCSGLDHDLIKHVDIVSISAGDADERGDGAAQIEQRVYLDGRLGGTEVRPGEQAQAQVDVGRVQRISGGIEIDAEALAGIEFALLRHQPLRQFGVDAPVAQLVGIGQSRAAHRRTKAHGVELIGLRVQARFDVAQALAISQLRERHGAVLLGASQGAHATITVVGHTACKRSPGDEIHQLSKQQLVCVHRRLQRKSLESASRQFQIDTTPKTHATRRTSAGCQANRIT